MLNTIFVICGTKNITLHSNFSSKLSILKFFIIKMDYSEIDSW